MNEHKKSLLTKANILYFFFASFMLLGCSTVFLELSEELREQELDRFDQGFISFIQGNISDRLTAVMEVLTFFGSVAFLSAAVLVAGAVLIFKKYPRYAVYLVISSGIGALFNYYLKLLFRRDRPSFLPLIQEHGFSFPSGHSMGSFIFYGSIAVILVKMLHSRLHKWIGAALLGLVILFIGISRVYLGVHYPSDVLAGFAAGGVWLTVCAVGLKYYEYRQEIKRGRKPKTETGAYQIKKNSGAE
ncbi:phosphatase PAP2 family protein [Peribacillus sp. SCS-26]|uniref:phosphatase PAP2 family protein n=1 Tax=Paraperibacillus marinus TaxID=3115295 RepID=UPI0039064408